MITVQDNIHGQIRMTILEKEILNSIPFNRLHDVYQDSLSFLTFPTNRTKRFEHSLGVMKICGDMAVAALNNTDQEIIKEILGEIKNCVCGIVNAINADNFWGAHLRSRVDVKNLFVEHLDYENLLKMLPRHLKLSEEEIFYASIMIQTIRCAGMLHDIGHPPFSHVVEESMIGVFEAMQAADSVFDKGSDRVKNFLKAMDICRPASTDKKDKMRKPHEAMGDYIAEQLFDALVTQRFTKDAEKSWAAIIQACVLKCFRDEGVFKVLHRFVDSTLDGDRLDFAIRDVRNAGFGEGITSYSRIVDSVKLIDVRKQDQTDIGDSFKIAFPVKCLRNVETFFQQYTAFYKDIIDHHRSAKLEFLLKRCVRMMIEAYLKEKPSKKEAEEKKDNKQSFIRAFDDISGLWEPLKKMWVAGYLDVINQWNDSWLFTLMRKKYFELAHDFERLSETDKLLKISLEELLRNTKKYYSLIKHQDNHRALDVSANEAFISFYKENAEKYRVDLDKKDGKDEAPVFDDFRKLLSEVKTPIPPSFLPRLSSWLCIVGFGEDANIIEMIREAAKSEFADKSYDVIVARGSIKNALGSDDVIFYSGDDIYSIDELSALRTQIDDIILSNVLCMIFVNSDTDKKDIDVNGSLKRIGEKVGTRACELILSQLSDLLSKK
ncbi:MAG: HD domain-containing protein [Bacilli bacterium]|nr:HD domain-containing protein [Bacilli bacterium]